MTRLRHKRRHGYDVLELLDDLFYRSPFDWVEQSLESLEMLGSPISFETTKDNTNSIKAVFQVPGYGKEDLEIDYANHTLVVKDKTKNDNEKHTLCLRARLPRNINPETIKAECKNGLLTVTAQHKETTSDKQIIHID